MINRKDLGILSGNISAQTPFQFPNIQNEAITLRGDYPLKCELTEHEKLGLLLMYVSILTKKVN